MLVSLASDKLNEDSKANWLWPFLLALLAFRLLFLVSSEIAVFYDEAQYHLWAVYLDWGYYSKPPMVAWIITLTTSLLGHSEWATKIGAPLLYCGTCWFIYDLSKRLFDYRTAKYAALIFFTMPMVHFNSLFITTDAPLLFFWALTLWLFVIAQSKDHLGLWALAGLAGGLGLLSKYTMGVLAIALLLFLLSDASFRKQLAKPGVWVACLVAAVVFLPNLIWNAQHDFISFQHTSEISKLDKGLFHLDKLAEFLAGQFLVFGPVAFWLLLCALRYGWARPKRRLLILASICMLVIICLQALLAHAYVNWAAPTYVAASILVARRLSIANKLKTLNWLVGINLFIGASLYFYTPMQQALGFEPSRKNTPYHRVSGWREVIHKIPSRLPNANNQIWLSDSRKLLSYLHFYLSDFKQKPLQLRSFNPDGKVDNHYDLLWDLHHAQESEWIFAAETEREFGHCFQSVEPLGVINHTVYVDLTRHIHLYRVRGFTGYENCN